MVDGTLAIPVRVVTLLVFPLVLSDSRRDSLKVGVHLPLVHCFMGLDLGLREL